MNILIPSVISLVLGSFGNTIISKYVNNTNFDIFRSKCYYCSRNLNLKSLIPLINIFLLKGKTDCCKKPLSYRYFYFELFTLILALVLFFITDNYIEYIICFSISYILLLIIFIDISTYIIPNSLLVVLVVIYFLKTLFYSQQSSIPSSFLISVIIMFIFISMKSFYKYYKKKDVLGNGDIKFLGIISLFFYLPSALMIIWFSSLLGILVFLIFSKKLKHKDNSKAIPFGSCIAMTSFLMQFFEGYMLNVFFTYLGL